MDTLDDIGGDIAATVCALLHIQMPNGCIGTPTQLK